MPDQTQMMQTKFAAQSASGADASSVAEMAASMWKAVGVALSPIIGHTAVAALLKRSIFLTRQAHPFLATVGENKSQPDEVASLQAALAQQKVTTAVAANVALLGNFQDLLIALIGLSLTERLLRPVWDTPPSGQTEQDIIQ